ncbi:MAG: hypothetical protein NTX53_10015 [candidate division WOR-3 bacterium]|nr:hypothetical protein [candidate division WOR-3 bacterium]
MRGKRLGRTGFPVLCASVFRKAHFGEVTVTVWPKQLREVCEKHNIFVLK